MVGQTISHYHIVEKLGEGGMGVVYKAEDTQLKRTVALKFLSSHALGTAEEKARFLREAQAAAALNHPNIATVYEIDVFEGEPFMAMEFIEGETLKQKIDSGPIELFEALEISKQVAAGLHAAHEKGIVHRDIKSGNIMLTARGQVKITDFGLAKMSSASMMTQTGSTLGTVPYMSPEQARGDSVDSRTDIWSLGIVLYEIVSGQMPFKGDYETAVIYSILHEAPQPLTALRTGVPMALERVVTKSMAKDPSDRYQHVEEIPVDLNTIDFQSTAASGLPMVKTAQPPTRWLRGMGLVLAGLIVGILVVNTGIWRLQPAPENTPLRKFRIPVIRSHKFLSTLPRNGSISPDGQRIAYVEHGQLWIRDLGRLESRRIDNIEGHATWPFWSPESDFVGYFDIQARSLKKVSIQGGASTTLCVLPSILFSGATWGTNGSIVFGRFSAGLFEVSAQGGKPRLMIKPDAAKGETRYISPLFLPDGRALLSVLGKNDQTSHLVLVSGETSTPIPGIPQPRIGHLAYSPTGHLLYDLGAAAVPGIWGVSFSFKTLGITDSAFLVEQNGIFPSVSADGTLVSASGKSSDDQLVWVNREGEIEGTIGRPQQLIIAPALSPDERQVAVTGMESGNQDIWIHDVSRGSKTRLTNHPAEDFQPAWSPAGDAIAFASRRQSMGDIFIKAANGIGTAKPLVSDPVYWEFEPAWTRDGKYLLYLSYDPSEQAGPRSMWYLPLVEEGKRTPFLQTSADHLLPVPSPGGQYVAYMSDESGEFEVYVARFPSGADKKQVSVNGGIHPKWNGPGDELFYVEGDSLMAVKVDRENFALSLLHQLFTGAQVNTELYDEGVVPVSVKYDVAADGQRFVVVQPVPGNKSSVIVVENWFAEFKDRK